MSRHPHRFRRGPIVRTVIALILTLSLGVLVIWGFREGRTEAVLEAEREQPVQAPSRVSMENGAPVVTLDAATQQRSGIDTAVPQPAPRQPSLRAYGTVLDLQELTSRSNSYASAKAGLETAQAKLAASRTAFERAQKLYKDRQNISTAQLQAAEASFRADQAALGAAEAQIRNVTATAQQSWGPALGQAVIDEAPMAARLIEGRDVLVQVTLPPGAYVAKPPEMASVASGSGARSTLRFVSPATKVDPRLQAPSFFYTAPADDGLLPGLHLLVPLPGEETAGGVVVPEAAIVWWQGKPWVYLRTGPETFARREIAPARPAPEGGYIVTGLPGDARLVVRGAQMLLSEEFRAEIQVGD